MALCIVFISTNAFADGASHRVVLVGTTVCCSDAGFPEAERALVDEMALQGITVIRVIGTATAEPAEQQELEQWANKKQAVAAIRIRRAGEHGPTDVALWIAGEASDETVYRTIRVERESNLPYAMVVAVRTVETLRASLMEFRVAAEGSTPGATTGSQTEPMAYDASDAAPRRIGAALWGGMALSPGGAERRGAFGASVLIEPLPALDISVSVDWSPIGNTLHTENALSELTFFMFRGWGRYRFLSARPVRFSFGLGGGAFLAQAEGRDMAGAALGTARTVVGYLGGAGRLALFAMESVSIFFDTKIGALLPRAEVRHGTRSAAVLGRPFVELSLGGAFRFVSF
jgi:hypothetical protein